MSRARPFLDDLIGGKINMLTIISFEWVKKGNCIFLCKCDCGKEIKVYKHSLLSHSTKSCGCYRKSSDWKIKYEKDSITECWNWIGALDKGEYGVVLFRKTVGGNKFQHKAHRRFYELYKGKIPENMLVCHHCDNTKCVNPDHLFIGSHKDNSDDKICKGRYRNKFTGPLIKPPEES